jgi:acyl-CoA thioester hydrolase
MHRFALRVRYGDTDQMGFAYYANYLRWFEIGRAEMLRSLGTTYRAVEESGLSLPVVEARCRYFKPARYDDEIVIHTAVAHLGRASVRFAYRITRNDDLLAEGETEHCFLTPDNRPARPSKELHALLERAPRPQDERPAPSR